MLFNVFRKSRNNKIKFTHLYISFDFIRISDYFSCVSNLDSMCYSDKLIYALFFQKKFGLVRALKVKIIIAWDIT